VKTRILLVMPSFELVSETQLSLHRDNRLLLSIFFLASSVRTENEQANFSLLQCFSSHDSVAWTGQCGLKWHFRIFLAGIFSANAVCVVASCIHDFDAFLFLFSSFESDMLLSPSA